MSIKIVEQQHKSYVFLVQFQNKGLQIFYNKKIKKGKGEEKNIYKNKDTLVSSTQNGGSSVTVNHRVVHFPSRSKSQSKSHSKFLPTFKDETPVL